MMTTTGDASAEAVKRLRKLIAMHGDDADAATLRALLARAEAAEQAALRLQGAERCRTRQRDDERARAMRAEAERDRLREEAQAARREEREACAAVCDDGTHSRSFGSWADAFEVAAKRIRARGDA